MTRYLLDTNVVSHIVDEPRGAVARRLRSLPTHALGLSIIVMAEIRFGLARRRSEARAERTFLTVEAIPVLPFEHPADQYYADIRAELERRGTPIGGNDLFIAAHALALDRVLVTANEDEFRRVPGLRVENWLADGQTLR